MAKRSKDKLYYEVTKEKPYGPFQMLMVGGSAGSVFGFLIASLVGAYEGMEVDGLVLSFLVASLLGFFFGFLLTWLFLHYFEGNLPISLVTGAPVEKLKENTDELTPESEGSPVVEGDEAKGKSVDFVFPELSPDKQ